MKKFYLFGGTAIILFVLLVLFLPHKRRESEFLGPPFEGEKEFSAVLFYLNSEGRFTRIEKEIKGNDLIENRIRNLIESLKVSTEGLISTVPPETEVKDVIFSDGIVYLNLSGKILNSPHGTKEEMEFLYGIVNSISATFPEVRGVKFLVDGEEIETLWGHISLKEPLKPDYEVFEE